MLKYAEMFIATLSDSENGIWYMFAITKISAEVCHFKICQKYLGIRFKMLIASRCIFMRYPVGKVFLKIHYTEKYTRYSFNPGDLIISEVDENPKLFAENHLLEKRNFVH